MGPDISALNLQDADVEELELLGRLLWTDSSLICLSQRVMKNFIIFSVCHDVNKVGIQITTSITTILSTEEVLRKYD